MFYERFARRSEASTLLTFPYPPADLRELVLAQDAICVSGGNTANMLAIWRVHGIDSADARGVGAGNDPLGRERRDDLLVRARRDGFVRAAARGMDCLGFLPGSACPHYDGEERRRPRYRELVDGGSQRGLAADDGVALHYVGTELQEVVSCRPGATAYRVTRDGEEALDVRMLG